MRLAEMKGGIDPRSGSHTAITQLTEEEQSYLQCLASGMTFQEMAVELGWTYHQVVEYRILLMRACNLPRTEELIRLYEESGDDKYRIAFAHLILDRLVERLGMGAEVDKPHTDSVLREKNFCAPPVFQREIHQP